MSKQKIEIEIPDGYEATGEYKTPVTGDFWLGGDGIAHLAKDETSDWKRVILRLKTRKVIVFVPVASYDEATPYGPESAMRFGVYNGNFGGWFFGSGVQWFRKEEREEPAQ